MTAPDASTASFISEQQAQFLYTPPPAPPGSYWRPDVIYGTAGTGGRALTLHLYHRDPGMQRPGIVFIHGGGWKGGQPIWLVRLAGDLAAKGYVTATISYRLSGEAPWPAALQDAKCAIRWLRSHSYELGLDAGRIAVAGGSAGGHLAAMIALTPGLFEGTGGWENVSSVVEAAILYNPATDLRSSVVSDIQADAPIREGFREAVHSFLGGTSERRAIEASPIAYVSPASPPILTRVGDKDLVTPVATCRAFHRRLDEAGVYNRLEIVPGKDHALPKLDHTGCVRATAEFLDDVFTSDHDKASARE